MNRLENYVIRISLLIFCCLPCLAAEAGEHPYVLKSPDGRLVVNVWATPQLAYAVSYDNRLLLDKSPVGLLLEGHQLGREAVVKTGKKRQVTERIEAEHYRCAAFEIVCNELDLQMKGNYRIIFRAYDEGMAYRFVTSMKQPFVVTDELAEMNFPEDRKTYMAYSTAKPGNDRFAMAFQNIYTEALLSGADTANIAFLPITVDCGAGVRMTLLESDLENYPGMFVTGSGRGTSLKAVFAGYPLKMGQRPPRSMTYVTERAPYIAKAEGKRSFPWRIWAVTAKDTDMPVNNLVYALASPNRVGDCSWVKTGKVAWDWWNDWGISGVDFRAGINTETYKHYIDFAAGNGIGFVVLDEGWYDPGKGNMMQVNPAVDLRELVRYGKEKGVDLILWAVFNVLDNQLEEACREYSAMGISGFKVDFLDRDDQTAVQMAYRLAAMTAKYKLSLDLHGFYKPTGFNRTFPHIINVESVFGMEEMKWSSIDKDMMRYDVTMPYIRMMAGPVDYTPGAMRNATKKDFRPVYNNPMSQGTRCHQLAAYIVHDSPLTMLADNPTVYRKEQECTDFMASVPNDGIRETRILQGELGAYIVTARRVGDNWYVGGMTDWNPREVNLDFGFLDEGNYQVTLFRDGINAARKAEDYKKEVFEITPHSERTVVMAPGGGFAMTIVRI